MKKKQIVLVAISLILFIECRTVGSTNTRFRGGKTESDTEGWIDKNTYRLVVVGLWNRDEYYIEGKKEIVEKEAKSPLGLKQDAKTAAKLIAMRNFQEKMGTYIKSKTALNKGKLINDEIKSTLEGITISPTAVKENYTADHDVRITYEFSTKGLRKNY